MLPLPGWRVASKSTDPRRSGPPHHTRCAVRATRAAAAIRAPVAGCPSGGATDDGVAGQE